MPIANHSQSTRTGVSAALKLGHIHASCQHVLPRYLALTYRSIEYTDGIFSTVQKVARIRYRYRYNLQRLATS
jgi:hypothetical protein